MICSENGKEKCVHIYAGNNKHTKGCYSEKQGRTRERGIRIIFRKCIHYTWTVRGTAQPTVGDGRCRSTARRYCCPNGKQQTQGEGEGYTRAIARNKIRREKRYARVQPTGIESMVKVPGVCRDLGMHDCHGDCSGNRRGCFFLPRFPFQL